MRRRRGTLVVAALLVVVVAVGIVTAPPAAKSPLDPTSDSATGTHALMLLAAGLGDRVAVGPAVPASRGGVALVLIDHLDSSDRSALDRWVDAGGTLVVTDATSALAGVAPDSSEADAVTPPRPDLPWPGCGLAPLQGVRQLDTSDVGLLDPSAGTGCFGVGHGALLVARRQGSGVVVVTSPAMWTNAELGHDDDAALAAGLLAPSAPPGGGPVTLTVIGASRVGSGSEGLLDLISPHVVEGAWGLVGAFGLYVAVRARRLGRPVAEAVPVELPGSGLVLATGNLLQEGGHRRRAAELLRADLRREVAERLGTPSATPPGTLAAIAAARTGIDAGDLSHALEGPPPGDDRSLVALARLIDHVREELAGAR